MLLKTRGIVFRSIKYGETSVIADIYTEERGLHTFIAGGVRSAKARMPFGLFQPMTVVDMVSYFKEEAGGMHRLKEMRSDEVFQATPFDVRRGAVALFMAEVCRKSIHEAEENRDLFEFLLYYLRWIDSTEHPIHNIHLHFLLGLSGHLGFQPDSQPEPEESHFFDLKEGAYLAETPLDHLHYLSASDTRHLLQLLSVPLEEVHVISMDRVARKSLLHGLIQFYRYHLPGFTEVNTPEVLDMVF